jgi:hypothetical protein
VCLESITGERVRAPCGHDFDIPCITHLFQAAVRDESTFPPRCCYMSIPLVSVQSHLTPDLIDRYVERDKESKIVNRVYCSRPRCSRFLGARLEGTILECPVPGCLTQTCGWCKVEVVPSSIKNHKCADNADVEPRVLSISREEGWARCPGCGQMVELNKGCNHIVCRCRTEFCYICAATREGCVCYTWVNPRLVEVAEGRVRHLHGAGKDRNHTLVRDAIAHLRSVHNCGYVRWKLRWSKFRRCQGCFRRKLWKICVSGRRFL